MALSLLKDQGWDPVGVSLKYAVWKNRCNPLKENICCSAESFKIAKKVCKELGTTHHIFNVSEEFKKQVIDYFLKELKNYRTPNPCIICNRYLKFAKLFEWAEKHNIKYVATGHYAGIRKKEKYELIKNKDKDQTYSLCLLPQKWLSRIIFPLEGYTKKQVYSLAKKKGFDFFLKPSQDFCFMAGQSLGCFLAKEMGFKEGLIKDTKGNVLGKHQGLYFYTIGQRKGVRLHGGPYFVLKIDVPNNVLIVTKKKKDLFRKEILLSSCHFVSGIFPSRKLRIESRIRSGQKLSRAVLYPLSGKKMKLVFDKPQRAVTPGQFAVFYQKDACLGGGRINCQNKNIMLRYI